MLGGECPGIGDRQCEQAADLLQGIEPDRRARRPGDAGQAEDAECVVAETQRLVEPALVPAPTARIVWPSARVTAAL